MRKLLVFLTTLLFAYASLATAENEAIYELDTGLVEVPVLSIKGQPDKYSAIFQQQDNGKLTFILTDTIPDPSIDSSTNEAIYDQENGTIIIPALIISGDEDLSDNVYFVELQEIAQQQTEESVFEVIQILDTSVQTAKALYGVSSSNATSARCSGEPDQNLDVARQNFQTKCGEPWNDQKHVCDYKPDGFHCNGNVTASTTPEPTNPTTSNPPATNPDWCTGTPDRNRDVAKINFRDACGQTWNDQLGHICESKSDGWHCSGTKVEGALNKPNSLGATRWHSRVVILNWQPSNAPAQIGGYEIFRNGNKIATTRDVTYKDSNASGNPSYQLVAFSYAGIRSPSTNAVHPSFPNALSNSNALTTRADSGSSEASFESRVTATNGSESRTATVTARTVTTVGGNRSTHLSAPVTNEDGERVGTIQQQYDGETVTVTLTPSYGPESKIDYANGDPSRLAPGITDNIDRFITEFPNRPTPPPTTTPGGGDCEDCPTNPRPRPVDQPGFFCPKGSSQEGGNRCVPNDKLSHCVGPVVNEQQPVEAKIAFGSACKTTYNDQLGHQCEWVADPQGWRCFK
ncbi:MAG: hypothetical protein V3V18_08340 [Methylococcales bacterium]